MIKHQCFKLKPSGAGPMQFQNTLWIIVVSADVLAPYALWPSAGTNIVNSLVQDCSNSSALAVELLQSCTKPSMFSSKFSGHLLLAWWCRLEYSDEISRVNRYDFVQRKFKSSESAVELQFDSANLLMSPKVYHKVWFEFESDSLDIYFQECPVYDALNEGYDWFWDPGHTQSCGAGRIMGKSH